MRKRKKQQQQQQQLKIIKTFNKNQKCLTIVYKREIMILDQKK